jgi:hypothetical protein
LKPEWWGSPLVQEEKYQEKPVKREEEEIIIIIIIIIIITFIFSIVQSKKRAGHTAQIRETKIHSRCYRILMRKPLGKQPHERLRSWEDNIKVGFREGWEVDGTDSGSYPVAEFALQC